MGKQNNAVLKYLSDKENFIDIINHEIQGCVIEKEHVKYLQERSVLLGERIRDVIAEVQIDDKGTQRFAIIGIEHQSHVDAWMVIRNFIYDAGEYEKQMKENKRLSKTAILKPVITFVLYLGDRPWRTKRNLREMVDVNETLKKFIPDYKLHIIDPHRMKDEEIRQYSKSFMAIMYMVKYSRNRKEMMKIMEENREVFENLDNDAVRVINETTNSHIEVNAKGETTDMLTGFEYVYAQSRQEGKAEGKIEGKAEGKKEGMMEGRQEEKIRMASALFKIGRPISEIALVEEVDEDTVRNWLRQKL